MLTHIVVAEGDETVQIRYFAKIIGALEEESNVIRFRFADNGHVQELAFPYFLQMFRERYSKRRRGRR
jgi:phosphoribulokinase